jgi:outer membrane lipase/esterase
MKIITAGRFVMSSCCAIFATQAYSQNLADFVNDPANGATDIQIQTGNAVQRACGTLAGQGGFSLEGQEGDLFLRCNEMVQTAVALQTDPTGNRPPRDLGLSSPELLSAVQNVAGEELFSQSTMSTRVTNAQFSNIAGRLNALRLGGTSAGAGGRVAYSDPYDNPDKNSPTYNQVSLSGGGAAGDYEVAGSRLGWFIEGSFNTGDRDQTDAENGFDFDATSVTLGLDYMLNSGVIGVSIGTDNYEAEFESNANVNGGGVDVDSTSGSLFGAFYSGNWYFDGILSFGSLDSDTDRSAFYTSANTCPIATPCPGVDARLLGSTSGDFFSGGATVGYDVNKSNWDITTSLSLSYRDIGIDGYTEVDPAGGGLTLSYADQTVDSFKSILGVSFSRAFSKSFGILSPQFRAEWHHEFRDDPQKLIAKYSVEELLANQGLVGAAGPGFFSLDTSQCFSCFQSTSDNIDTDFGLVGIGLAAIFSQRVQLYGVFDFLVGSDHMSSSTFSVGLRGQF